MYVQYHRKNFSVDTVQRTQIVLFWPRNTLILQLPELTLDNINCCFYTYKVHFSLQYFSVYLKIISCIFYKLISTSLTPCINELDVSHINECIKIIIINLLFNSNSWKWENHKEQIMACGFLILYLNGWNIWQILPCQFSKYWVLHKLVDGINWINS